MEGSRDGSSDWWPGGAVALLLGAPVTSTLPGDKAEASALPVTSLTPEVGQTCRVDFNYH